VAALAPAIAGRRQQRVVEPRFYRSAEPCAAAVSDLAQRRTDHPGMLASLSGEPRGHAQGGLYFRRRSLVVPRSENAMTQTWPGQDHLLCAEREEERVLIGYNTGHPLRTIAAYGLAA